MAKSFMNLDVTYQYARDKIAMKDPAAIAENAGVDYDPTTGLFTVKYLGDNYTVSYQSDEIKMVAGEFEVPIINKILLLHYLINANGTPMQDKYISFKELPDGAIYIEPFTNRAVRPMLKYFAEKQEKFVELAHSIGGAKQKLGDTSVTVWPFPRVPITYVIWSGDDEFPASGNILFDASAPGYLPTEDYAMLSGMVLHHLAGLMQQETV